MKVELKNTKDNKARIEALSSVKEIQWVGEITHDSIDKCLTAINLMSSNSGWYKPTPIRLPKHSGIFMVNEDGSLFYESRIIKCDKGYKIEHLSSKGFNIFENAYCNLV